MLDIHSAFYSMSKVSFLSMTTHASKTRWLIWSVTNHLIQTTCMCKHPWLSWFWILSDGLTIVTKDRWALMILRAVRLRLIWLFVVIILIGWTKSLQWQTYFLWIIFFLYKDTGSPREQGETYADHSWEMCTSKYWEQEGCTEVTKTALGCML